ncbi:alpha/beta fold hydrolase [Streptomyces sp. NPDC004069]
MSRDRPRSPGRTGAAACTVHRKRATGGTRALLLHGLANSSSVWDELAGHEAGGLDLWAAELPWGGGGSPDWAYGQDASRAVADALGQVPGGTGVVVAHSFSTVLLLDLLSEELARGGDPFARLGIEGLVLVSPFYRRDPESFEYGVVGDMLENFRRTMEEGIRVVAGPRLDPSLRRDMAQRVCERVGPYGYLSFFRSYLHTPWLRTDLITVPCLVIGGEDDFTAVPAESTALAAALPDARCRFIPGAGHFPMVERADAFSAALGEFLDALGRTAPAAVDQPA